MGYFNYQVLPVITPGSLPQPIADGYSVSHADGYSFLTPWIDLKNCREFSISVNFSGTATGTLLLQSSDESDFNSPMGNIYGTQSALGTSALGPQPVFNGQDATTIAGTSTSITTAGVTFFDSGLLYISNPGLRWVRVSYVGTAGSSLVSIWFNGKFH